MACSSCDARIAKNSRADSAAAVFRQRMRLRLFLPLFALLLAATAYVDVLSDTAIVSAANKNVAALQDQLRQTKARHSFGDVTKTDVAQIESRLAASQAQQSLAVANL